MSNRPDHLVKRILRQLYRGWMAFAHALARFNTFLILSFIYLVVIGLMSPFFRLFARDPLDRRMKDRNSIWVARPKSNLNPEEARRLF